MPLPRTCTQTVILGCATLALAACGSSDDDPGPVPNPEARACSLAAYADVSLPDARITGATEVGAGAYQPPGSNGVLDALPSFCRIEGVAMPSSQSNILFELWIPSSTQWNGKLVATGNGGYSPALSYGDMAYALRQGYAVLGGDTGHQTEDMLWGVDQLEKIVDWGTRSVHAITAAGKQILASARAQPPSRAYFLGCSTGGHQGFAQSQRYPQDFDGIIAGAPGNNRTALNIEFLWRFRANRPFGDNHQQFLQPAQLQFITRQATAACDGLDGVADGVISDPRRCTAEHFDIGALACSATGAQPCLSDEQLAAAQAIYGGPRNPRTGQPLYPGWPVGSEAGWSSYLGTTEPVRADFWRHWVFNDTGWDWWRFDFDHDVAYAYDTIAPLVDQTSADLSAFRSAGSKMIVFHGWNDPVVSAFDSIDYYEKVVATQGSREAVDAFYRLLLVPGMGHCGGGTGATVLRGDGQQIPLTPERDILQALDRWVETGQAPDDFVASSLTEGQVGLTRPLCAYPLEAVHDGAGAPDDAASFSCQSVSLHLP